MSRYITFTLSMPGVASWNGRWSGEGRRYVIVKKFSASRKGDAKANELLAMHSRSHHWDDGWCARVDIREVDAKTASLLRRTSDGFCGYDWMVANICLYGQTEKPEQPTATAQAASAP
jgi:hypothetical protein